MKEESKPEDFPGQLIALILKFCETNKGFSRILTREIFTADEVKIIDKVSNCFEKINIEIRQSFRNMKEQQRKN